MVQLQSERGKQYSDTGGHTSPQNFVKVSPAYNETWKLDH